MAVNTLARVQLSLKDGLGVRSSFLAHALIDDASTVAGVNTALNTLKTNYATISGASILSASLAVISPGPAAAAAADSRVAETMTIDFSNAVTPYHYGQANPAILDSLILNGKIDTTNPAYQAWRNYLLAAFLGGSYTNPEAQAFLAAAYAFLSDRKHRRRLHELTYTLP